MTSTEAVTPIGVAQIITQMRNVADVRRDAKRVKDALAAKTAAFETENAALIAEAKAHKTNQEHAEAALRALILAHYELTKEAKPAKGAEVKMQKGLTYDAAAAFSWAKEKGMALLPESLDVAAFEKIASVSDLPFVTKTETPQAQIATDMDKALAGVA